MALYLGECTAILWIGPAFSQWSARSPQSPLTFPPVAGCCLSMADTSTRTDHIKARITSTFGSILEMNSTKKGNIYLCNKVQKHSVYSHTHISSMCFVCCGRDIYTFTAIDHVSSFQQDGGARRRSGSQLFSYFCVFRMLFCSGTFSTGFGS